MPLALHPPLAPMLSKPISKIPPDMAYEPKWDGFRCLVFRDHDDVTLWSRGGKDLAPYFPELVTSLLDNTPFRCVLDGEIVIIVNGRLSFPLLTERIHPAASRISKLSETAPASYIAWDVLALDSIDLSSRPLSERRAALERALSTAESPIYVSPQTLDADEALRWFDLYEGAGCDGVIAKPLDAPYLPGQRTMFKIKHQREADVVVAGYRLHKISTPERPLLGSLQCGLYDDQGRLVWVGASASFTTPHREQFLAKLAPLALEPGSLGYQAHPWGSAVSSGARRPGGESHWAGPLKETILLSELIVAQVCYEHLEGGRFRNNPRFQRWRPDREPASCTFQQLDVPVGMPVTEILH